MSITPLRVVALWAATALLLGTPPARADTECIFGGPTPGVQATRLDLPSGSPFLTLELSTTRTTRPLAGEEDWHLALGIIVINADSLDVGAPVIEAYRVASMGMWPRRAVVRADGATLADAPAPAPEVPYTHERSRLRDGLPPGSYLVVAFGTDGAGAVPNEYWTAGIQVAGSHACTPAGEGDTFDYDQTGFTEGTQAYAPGAGYARNIRLAVDAPRRIAVGLMDAQTQAKAASSVEVAYVMPGGTGTLSQEMQPFVSLDGSLQFQARYTGWSPLVLVAGASVDLAEMSPIEAS